MMFCIPCVVLNISIVAIRYPIFFRLSVIINWTSLFCPWLTRKSLGSEHNEIAMHIYDIDLVGAETAILQCVWWFQEYHRMFQRNVLIFFSNLLRFISRSERQANFLNIYKIFIGMNIANNSF